MGVLKVTFAPRPGAGRLSGLCAQPEVDLTSPRRLVPTSNTVKFDRLALSFIQESGGATDNSCAPCEQAYCAKGKSTGAVAKELILSGSPRPEDVAMIAPVTGFTLRYGTVNSFAVRRTVYHHTAPRGTRGRLFIAATSRNGVFQRKDSAIIAGQRCCINDIFLVPGRA